MKPKEKKKKLKKKKIREKNCINLPDGRLPKSSIFFKRNSRNNWLRGSDKLSKIAQEVCKTNIGETSNDEKFTVVEVECLGACSNGPMIQINNDFYEDLDEESTKKIIDNIKEGKPNVIGSQKGRRSSENA